MTYQYDALNRLSQVCDKRLDASCAVNGPGITTYSYDATGNLFGYTYPNTVKTSNVFDPLNRLTQTCSATTSPACSAGTKLSSYLYGLGTAGNRLNATELNSRQVMYGYDNDYRLTSEAISSDPAGNNGTVSYTQYDATGNRQAMTSTLNAVPGGIFSYDANDRLALDTYDANGNTTSSASITNVYDFENRMTQHGTNPGLLLAYDGDGNRVSGTIGGTTTKYLVDALNPSGLPQVLDEIVSGSVTRIYAYGLQRISENQLVSSTWTPSFYGYDGHGNVRFLTNASGAITDSYDDDAFGMPIKTSGTTANTFRYSGERYDSSIGLYDLRARYYNQATGRFWARDPVPGAACNPLTYNPYIYANDDPVDLVDPDGTQAMIEYLLLIHFIQGFQVHPALPLPCPLNPPNKGAGTPSGAGYYICCKKGKLAVCEGTPDSDSAVRQCQESHEQRHMNDFGPLCPNICDGQPNGPVTVPKAYSNRYECAAYCTQWKCLKGKGPTDAQRRGIRIVEHEIRDRCGKSPEEACSAY